MNQDLTTNNNLLIESVLEEISKFFETRESLRTEFDNFWVIVKIDEESQDIIWDFEIKDPEKWTVDSDAVVEGVFQALSASCGCGCGDDCHCEEDETGESAESDCGCGCSC